MQFYMHFTIVLIPIMAKFYFFSAPLYLILGPTLHFQNWPPQIQSIADGPYFVTFLNHLSMEENGCIPVYWESFYYPNLRMTSLKMAWWDTYIYTTIAVLKITKKIIGQMYNFTLLLSFTVISVVYMSFIPNKTTFT